MIVWGHGRRLQTLGSVGRQECPKCGQVANIFLGVLKKQFTLYWIPVIRWDGDYYLMCGICNASALIDKSLGARLRDEVEGRTVPGGGQSLPPKPGPDPTTGRQGGSASTPTQQTETFYDILGVAPEATADEIRRSYHIRAQLVHPDHHAGGSDEVVEEARRQMRLLNEAWEVLRDTDRRTQYDAVLNRGSAQQAQPRPERTQEKPTTPRPSPTSRSEDQQRDDHHRPTESSTGDNRGALIATLFVVVFILGVIGVAIVSHNQSSSATTQTATTQDTPWNIPTASGLAQSSSQPDFAYVFFPPAQTKCLISYCWNIEVDSRYDCPGGIVASVVQQVDGTTDTGTTFGGVSHDSPVMITVDGSTGSQASDPTFTCKQ